MNLKEFGSEVKMGKINKSSALEVTSFLQQNPHHDLIILDFDETLWLRNSTEEYLNRIQPRGLAVILLILLDIIKPWNFLPKPMGGETCRDWIRVILLTIIFPWNIWLWKKYVRKCALEYLNTELTQAVKSHQNSRIIIASKGFDFIIRPILKHLNLAIDELIACRFLMGCIDRHKNKEDLIASQIDLNDIRNSVVVTDSRDDASLLAIVKHPFLVVWDKAKYIPAMADAYIPFFYLEKVKRPGKQTVKNIIIKNHLVSLILALSFISPAPILHISGITLLVIAFWCIYEIGYHENDLVAEKFENKPVLSDNYQKYKSRMNPWQPWIWALTISFMGILFIEASQISIWERGHLEIAKIFTQENQVEIWHKCLLWLGVLLWTRLTYVLYNYLDEQTRIWIYPILQVWKFFGFLAVTASNIIGVILLFAQLLVEWIPYSIYRHGGERKQFQEQTFRLIVYTFFCLAMAIGMNDLSIIINVQFLVIFIWSLLRSRSELIMLWNNAYLLSQSPPKIQLEQE